MAKIDKFTIAEVIYLGKKMAIKGFCSYID
jgi:hypothetical protein